MTEKLFGLLRIFWPVAKRFVMAAVAAGVVALNKKLGLDLDPVEIAGVVLTAVTYLLSDAWKYVADSRADALASAVKATSDSASVALPPRQPL